MSRDTLTVTLAGEDDAIPAGSLVTAIDRVVALLQAVAAEMPERCRIDEGWQVVDVSHSNPFAVEVAGASSYDEGAGAAVIDASLDGLCTLDQDNATAMPRYFNAASLEAARDIVSLLDDGLSYLALDAEGRESVEPSQQVAASASRLLPKKHDELGTIQGRIETLQMHGGPRFAVWDVVTGARVECQTDDDGLARAHEAWGQRVRLFGRITYSTDNKPERMAVEEIEPLPPEEEVPSALTLDRSDITDGETGRDHTRKWLHGEAENRLGQ